MNDVGRRILQPIVFRAVCLLLALGSSFVLAGESNAESSFVIIGEGQATDISADGLIVVGLAEETGETWRWDSETGMVPLTPGVGSSFGYDPGTPDLSRDGEVLSTTLPLGEDPGEAVIGVWSRDDGVTRCATDPGRAQGLSDDGTTVVGVVWEANGQTGATRAVSWSRRDGLVALGHPKRNSQANDANLDGSVIVGWSEDPVTGFREPTVWTEEGQTVLAATPAFCEATAVSPDGRIIIGQVYDETLNRRVAALWLRSDFGWVQEELGALPGTFAGYGQALALDLSADGRVIVGRNSFDRSRSTGFVWTPETGLVDVRDHLARLGIDVPEEFTIEALTGVSDAGTVMTGYGRMTDDWPFKTRSFLVRTPEGPSRVVEQPNDEEQPPTLPAQMDPGPLKKFDSRDRNEPWRD